MLTSLHVQNFKCLRDVQLDLGPFTVLIGPNDSGKSSILDALRILGRTVASPRADIFKGDDDIRHLVWKHRPSSRSIEWTVKFRQETNTERRWLYSLNVSDSGSDEKIENIREYTSRQKAHGFLRTELCHHISPPEGDSEHDYSRSVTSASDFQEFAQEYRAELLALSQMPRYRLNPEHLRRAAVPTPDTHLSPDGNNFAAVIDRLLSGPDRTAVARLEQRLQEVIPTLRGIALRTIDGKTGAKALEFVLHSDTKGPPMTIPCAHASDGAMLLTAFLALAFSDDPGLLIIEEPENGLHPSRLKDVVDMLRQISEGALGNQPRQVILTTHSPLLLNYTRPEEVRIVRRDLELGTQVTPMADVPDIGKLLEEFGAGELWYLLGEQALVEGKKP